MPLMPAKAGIPFLKALSLDSRLRGNERRVRQPIALGSQSEICGNAIKSAMISTSQARNQ